LGSVKDVTTSLPYVDGIHIALDHHSSKICGIEISRTSETDIGELMFKYGRGSFSNIGKCQFENDVSERGLSDLIEIITKDE
tara:strand:+ start:229 stop:474 length:246 start_codon:yes stop_codon:yes gene_type:complete